MASAHGSNGRPGPLAFLAAAIIVALAGCGYVGDPLPPALYIPMPVTDLSAAQLGDTVVLRFTLPARSTEDLALEEFPEIDLRGAVWENRDWNESEWEREATRLSTLPPERNAVQARSPVENWAGKRVLFRVRVAGKLGRFSAWSDAVPLRVLPALRTPPGFVVASAAEGARIAWDLPEGAPTGLRTEIFRRPADGEEFTLLQTAEGNEWIDSSAAFGESYAYRIRSRVEGDERNALSAFTAPLTITPIDSFAPAPPQDVAAVAGATGVELSWTRNAETDFRGYRIYRSDNGADFASLSEPAPTPTYSDRGAPTGIPLRYRVTSLDRAGNESAPSAIAEITLP